MERSVAKRETLDASHLGWVCDRRSCWSGLPVTVYIACIIIIFSLYLSLFLYSHSVHYTLFYSIPIVYSTILLLPHLSHREVSDPAR